LNNAIDSQSRLFCINSIDSNLNIFLNFALRLKRGNGILDSLVNVPKGLAVDSVAVIWFNAFTVSLITWDSFDVILNVTSTGINNAGLLASSCCAACTPPNMIPGSLPWSCVLKTFVLNISELNIPLAMLHQPKFLLSNRNSIFLVMLI